MAEKKTVSERFESLLMRLSGARVLLLFLFHALVFSACYTFAYLVRFEFAIPPGYYATVRASLPVVVGVQLLAGVIFGFYRGWWRYVGAADVVRIAFGLSTALVLLVAAWYAGTIFGLDDRFVRSPRSVLLTDWAFAVLTLFGVRLLIRVGRDRFRPQQTVERKQKRVLIIGAGDAGEALAREIEHRPQLGVKVVAFVDDQRAKWASQIRGIRVHGPITNVASLATDFEAEEALIAIPSASGRRMREIIHHLSEAHIQFKTIPGIDHLVTGKVQLTQLRPVNVEDLLRRKRIELPGDPVRQLFNGRRVLITGAGGTIGSELASQILKCEPQHLTLVERSEFALYDSHKRLMTQAPSNKERLSCDLLDIQDRDLLENLISIRRPEVVIHAAAHKHVPLGEANPAEYIRNNTLATRDLATICIQHGVRRFVFISTDKAINPTSVMGASKRAAEIALVDAVDQSPMTLTIVRFGNVIGSSGSVIPLFIEQIAAGGPVTVTHPEVTRYFLRTSEAVSLVLQAAAAGSGGHVFMLDMGEPMKILDLARDLIRLSNHSEEEIPIVFTGLRPGEKLFEEVRLVGESVQPTAHPHIVVTEPPQPDPNAVARWLSQAYVRLSGSPEGVLLWLKDIIPEYKPRGEDGPMASDQVLIPMQPDRASTASV